MLYVNIAHGAEKGGGEIPGITRVILLKEIFFYLKLNCS
jgi:hypothetical protein